MADGVTVVAVTVAAVTVAAVHEEVTGKTGSREGLAAKLA